MRRILGAFTACAMFALCALPAFAQNVEKAPPGPPYKKVSELVKLPDFIPGISRGTVACLRPSGPPCQHDLHDPFERSERPEELEQPCSAWRHGRSRQHQLQRRQNKIARESDRIHKSGDNNEN